MIDALPLFIGILHLWLDSHLKLTVHLCKATDERADLLTKAMGKDNASYKLFRDDIMNVRSVA